MNRAANTGARRLPARRGSTYAFVLLTAASIALLSVTAVLAQRLRTRVASREAGGRTAQLLAMSAIEHALHTMENVRSVDPLSWRGGLRSMSFAGPVDGGTIAWGFQNAGGGPMSTDESKPFYAVGVGTHGTASNSLRVAVRPSGPAFSSLEVALWAKQDLQLASGTVVQADGTIGANHDVEATSSSVFADVAAASAIAGGTYHGATTTFAPLRGMPDGDVFDYYLANGTVIDESSLPSSFDDRFIEDVVLSPASNPFGDANPEGIYVVECHGKNLIIRNTRILGTVVLVAIGPDSEISESICWTAPSASVPAVLVAGDQGIAIGLSSADLVETARGVNFNPAGTPYEGDEDATLDDAYPSLIRGLVYSKGPLTFRPPHTRIEGVVVGGSHIFSETGAIIEIEYTPKMAEDPPPGFFVPDGGVRIGAFSWERAPD